MEPSATDPADLGQMTLAPAILAVVNLDFVWTTLSLARAGPLARAFDVLLEEVAPGAAGGTRPLDLARLRAAGLSVAFALPGDREGEA